jgi:trehalose-6-phosphate synthase
MNQNKSVGCRYHTYDYARHFVSACTRILGLEGTPEGVEDQGKLTRVAAVCLLVPKKSSSWP